MKQKLATIAICIGVVAGAYGIVYALVKGLVKAVTPKTSETSDMPMPGLSAINGKTEDGRDCVDYYDNDGRFVFRAING